MLFDLRGKRKRFIQVIYAGLAILMGGGLVLFGIGGDVSGGLFDAFREGKGTGSPAFEREIESARKRLAKDPRDRGALLDLTRAHFQQANAAGGADQEDGTYSEAGLSHLERSVAAWERYLRTKPPRPSIGVALLVVRAYEALQDYQPAVRAQQVVVDARPSKGSYLQLAVFAYYAHQFGKGDKAVEKALALTPKEERADLRDQLRLTRFGQQAVNYYVEGQTGPGDKAAKRAIAVAPSERRKELRKQLKELKEQVESYRAIQQAKQQAQGGGQGGQQQLPPGVPPPPGFENTIPSNSPFAFPQGGQVDPTQ